MPPTPQREDLLSIVVIGRNEGERLALCLDSIAHMHHPGFEVETIYVDSGSTDHSLALAEARGARVIALHPERPSAALGRNAGWRAARGATILFLDGDTLLHPDFVAASLPDLAAEPNAVVWGHRRETHPEQSLYNRVLDLDWIYAPGFTLFCGGDALFRHSVLAATGGYDDTLIAGEEPELCRRIAALGHTILHVDRAMTGHDLAIHRFAQYWKRSHRAGHAYAEVAHRLQSSANLDHSQQTFWADETARNRNRALTLMAVLPLAFLLTIAFRSSVPLLLALAFYTLIILRSAYKARWKSTNKLTLLLYGVHSHLAQVPIYFGQREYQSNLRKGQRAALVEYK
jgi:cellulose synthase/poly-beta-1,6-N-acetylglucosamine synthase-like glycosyltransferase